jgi:tripartite-type tricarboxylate transporter receptor subunit TctC
VGFSRRQFLRSAAAGAAALPFAPRIARAQAWPARPVRFVVGFPAGGGADATTRILAAQLSEIWGQQVVVENKGGAGGNLAHEMVARAAPDGYTMLMATGTMPVNPFLFANLTYDPMTDFAPVSLIGTYPNLVVVPANSPLRTLQDFIAKGKRETINYATPGVGTIPHLAAELLRFKAGINLTHIPYRGVAAGAMNDLLAGRIDCMFNTTGSLLQSVKSGQTRALGITSEARDPGNADIPTFAEAGVPGFVVVSWYGIYAPAKTPADILRRMNEGAVKALAEPAVKTRFEPLGVTVESSTPQALAARMKADVELWGPIIKAANIKGE